VCGLVATTIAVVAALCAAFCFAVGSILQQGVARQADEGTLRFQLLWYLVRQPRWVAGVGLNAFSFVLQGLALVFGPLTLVQPLAATDVLFALPLIARRYHRRLTRRDALGALAVTAGIAVFLAVSPPVGGVSTPSIGSWIPVFLAVGGLVALAAVVALRVQGRPRVVWLAAAAGVLYALGDALIKSTVDLLSDVGVAALARWEPYALLATGIVGALFGQSAFSAGALSLSLPIIDTLEPVCAVVIGATIFGEQLASSPLDLGFQLFGGAVAVIGVIVLSSSKIVEAETVGAPEPVGTGDGGGASKG
jgi:drug/metabolite transporter (DMT)-like permease